MCTVAEAWPSSDDARLGRVVHADPVDAHAGAADGLRGRRVPARQSIGEAAADGDVKDDKVADVHGVGPHGGVVDVGRRDDLGDAAVDLERNLLWRRRAVDFDGVRVPAAETAFVRAGACCAEAVGLVAWPAGIDALQRPESANRKAKVSASRLTQCTVL